MCCKKVKELDGNLNFWALQSSNRSQGNSGYVGCKRMKFFPEAKRFFVDMLNKKGFPKISKVLFLC